MKRHPTDIEALPIIPYISTGLIGSSGGSAIMVDERKWLKG